MFFFVHQICNKEAAARRTPGAGSGSLGRGFVPGFGFDSSRFVSRQNNYLQLLGLGDRRRDRSERNVTLYYMIEPYGFQECVCEGAMRMPQSLIKANKKSCAKNDRERERNQKGAFGFVAGS